MLRSNLRDGLSVTALVGAVGGLQRVLGWLLASVLAGVGAVTGMVGAGLALLGVCCAGPAITVGTAAAATTAGAGSVYSKPFLVVAALLGLAAFVVYRRLVHSPARATASPANSAAAAGLHLRSGSLSSGARS